MGHTHVTWDTGHHYPMSHDYHTAANIRNIPATSTSVLTGTNTKTNTNTKNGFKKSRTGKKSKVHEQTRHWLDTTLHLSSLATWHMCHLPAPGGGGWDIPSFRAKCRLCLLLLQHVAADINSQHVIGDHLHTIMKCTFLFHARIIGWGIRFKLQMLCPQEDE